MNRQPGKIGLYLVLIVMLVAGYFYLNNQVTSQSNYTMEELQHPCIRTGRYRRDLLWQRSRAKDRKRSM